jgi:hypothetical protein
VKFTLKPRKSCHFTSTFTSLFDEGKDSNLSLNRNNHCHTYTMTNIYHAIDVDCIRMFYLGITDLVMLFGVPSVVGYCILLYEVLQ